jgi:hypothetical protein
MRMMMLRSPSRPGIAQPARDLSVRVEALKPEAAYFATVGEGDRGGFIVFDLQETSQIPGIAEQFFLAFNAKVTFTPVMNAQDLMNTVPGIEKAVKAHAQASGS